MKYLKLYILLVCGFLGICTGFAQVELEDLTTEYLEKPLGIDVEHPRFSWKMVSKNNERGLRQKSYQIEVVDDEENVVWHTNATTDTSLNILYKGSQLKPETRYTWHLQVVNSKNDTLKATSWFETGLMNPDKLIGWDGAQWIGGETEDLPLYAQALSVFKVAYKVRLDKKSKSTKAGFIFGANDERLMNRNLNIFEVQHKKDNSYLLFEVDIAPLRQQKNAVFNVYRKGYTKEEDSGKLLYTFPIAETLINNQNKYDWHHVYFEMNFGKCLIYINGRKSEHLINSKDEPEWVDVKGVSLNPLGDAGGDLLVYPVLANIGFKAEKGQVVSFKEVAIYNYRAPSNPLFKENLIAPKESIFYNQNSALKIKKETYYINARKKGFLITKDPSRNAMPMLRSQFNTSKEIKKARLYTTARGVYELYLNGQKVNHNYFAPGLTQYNKLHMYQTYDVTQLLKKGNNTFGALLGEGWWTGNISYRGYNWNYFGDRTSLISKLVITYDDNTSETIVSNPKDWKLYTDGPIRYASFFQGEYYDAHKEEAIEGWLLDNYNDDKWKAAIEVPLNENTSYIDDELDYKDQKIIGQIGESPNIVKELSPISVKEIKPGVFIYDMGQNMVGFPKIELTNTTADTIRLRYAEMLYPDLPQYQNKKGTLMLENIRGALATDQYIVAHKKTVTIQPKFTFHGFRYLEITGIDKAIPLNKIKGMVVSSIDHLSSSYKTSNPKVNKLWENITWSFRSNFLSIPTDTPARNERMGWNGDINVFSETATYLGDVNMFLNRHLIANRNLQASDGRFPDIAPIGTGFGGTLWGSAGVTIPWTLYKQYGDKRVLEEHYSAMKRYLEFLSTKENENGILLEGPLGDWLSPVGYKNDNTMLWTAYQIHCLDILSKSATLLGFEDDAESFKNQYQDRLMFFNDTYLNDELQTIHSGVDSGSFASKPENYQNPKPNDLVDTQASYAIPINFNLIDTESFAKHFFETIQRENVDHLGSTRPSKSLMTGFIGTAALLPALSKSGNDSLAYDVLQQTTYPSWLYSVENGATTIWERLNSYTKEDGFGGNNSMNSFNHYSFGAVGAWMYAYSLGIQPLESGYKKILLTPRPDLTGKMTWAEGFYEATYGRIESKWKVVGNKTIYNVTIPPNTEALLQLISDSDAKIEFKSYNTRDIQDLGSNNNFATYRLLSGQYEISVYK